MGGVVGQGGLFSVLWGLGAGLLGAVLATDFRGSAERFVMISERTMMVGSRNRRPVMGTRGVRLLGGVFALAGPVVSVVGLVELARSDGAQTSFTVQPPLPFLLFAAVAGIVGEWLLWRPDGPLRDEWAAGGSVRRTALVALSATAPLMLGTMALGWTAAAPAGLLVAAVAMAVILPEPYEPIDDGGPPARPGSQQVSGVGVRGAEGRR
ncbi:hypothetical protein ACFV5N_01680 [Streptomyces sp. NPDC059853]|uniref:hypothetical protein n=1 Tax=Streptomyces sp. NPDC059853 TaxID=3346973 RepID=UPI0036661099